MAGKDILGAGAALTADGTSDGSITVASTTPFRETARAMLSDNDSPHREVIIVQIVSATVMKVRFVTPDPVAPDQAPRYALNPLNYGFSDVSAYTVAQSARIDMPNQFIYNENSSPTAPR